MVIGVQKFILILIRITSFIVVCPGFSFKGLPNIFKIALATGFSFLVYTTTPDLELLGGMFEFFMLAIKESLFGLSLGYVTNLVFAAMEVAGQLIDFQAGFSMASVYDPSIGIKASNYGRLYYWMSICAFFLLDMHHKVISALISSFEYIPLGMITINGNNVEAILKVFSRIFETAVNLAAPVIIVVLVTDVVLAVISRTIPQINVLILGMPLKAMMSYFIVMISISWILSSMGNILQLIPGYLEGFIKLF